MIFNNGDQMFTQSINASAYPSGFIISHTGYQSQSYPSSKSANITLLGLHHIETDVVIVEFDGLFDVERVTYLDGSSVCFDGLIISERYFCGHYSSLGPSTFRISTDTLIFFLYTDYHDGGNRGFKLKYTGAVA